MTRPLRPKANHICHQKPNPFRETIPILMARSLFLLQSSGSCVANSFQHFPARKAKKIQQMSEKFGPCIQHQASFKSFYQKKRIVLKL
jgi:hypothetical protein